jgi:phenol hydroxylase P5 protein
VKPRECRAEVVATRQLGPGVIEVDVRMVEPEVLRFDAGQWVSVPFGPKTVRAYSMASPPSRSRVVTLSADVAPGGIGSRWIRELTPGAPVRFKGPTGGFTVNRADPRRTLFVAEEIGIVPIRSMLLDVYETGFGRANALLHWAPTAEGLLYESDFASLARRYPSFAYFPVVREAPAGWRGERGEAHEAVDRLVHSVDRLTAYVCGGAQTIGRVRDVLVGKGMDRKSVRWEKFW